MRTATIVSAAADEQIVRAYAADAAQGVRLLLRAHGGRVRKVLSRRYAYVLDEDHLDAAVYDAAQKALSRHDGTRGSLGGWFLFLADRQAVNFLRAEEPHRTHTVPLGENEFADQRCCGPHDQAATAELAAAVAEVMKIELSELERGVIQADIDADGAASVQKLAQHFDTTNWSIYAARARGRAKLLAALTPARTED